MYDKSGVRLSLIHSLPNAAEATGVSVDRLLALGGLRADAFRDHDMIVRRSQIVAMMNGLARKSGDASLGFKMAETTNPNHLGPFGRSLMVGRTLKEALALQSRHLPWLQRGTSIAIATVGPMAQWTHRMHGCDPAEARFLTEGIAAFFVRFVRASTGDADAGLHVILPHKPVAPLSFYEDALRCAVSFDKDTDLVIRFDAALLDRRNALLSVDDGVQSKIHDLVPDGLDLPDTLLLASLQRMFEAAALWGRLTLEGAALTLGLSPRSLQRRLARLDTSFERVLDDWRQRQAVTFFNDPGVGTASVALRLGYTHPAHFIRAFRRWHGQAPTEFRLGLARNGN
ncbi:MAG: AraC family transcriptional regulator ligand-binding domain-containing protein [Rhodobacterales bacterium]|nr:AraC family transcriptional regulator ligand-binding domain-containing protein [Rhodobacterales bacterium]